jgi:hypothetical protein
VGVSSVHVRKSRQRNCACVLVRLIIVLCGSVDNPFTSDTCLLCVELL